MDTTELDAQNQMLAASLAAVNQVLDRMPYLPLARAGMAGRLPAGHDPALRLAALVPILGDLADYLAAHGDNDRAVADELHKLRSDRAALRRMFGTVQS